MKRKNVKLGDEVLWESVGIALAFLLLWIFMDTFFDL